MTVFLSKAWIPAYDVLASYGYVSELEDLMPKSFYREENREN
jgi:hypothetical protein